ncbi:MAG: ketoacyl-ACP synthase III [Saprospiraceae bacterium]|nr:ketoacyl-ACP synthase III [Bacteroidia bacterium]NNF22569.1 ketoacyl-ACP synthase III [Saprospiraceae bacterium]NNK89287.1 ketoacyl-ACP synthase III [Saprospiraceae bacterium]
MSNIKAVIKGVAGYVPEDVLTNKDLEKMVDTNDDWIRTRTGIKKRHILKDKNKATSDLGAEAVKVLLDKTGVKPEEIELIIVATVTADYPFPDTANLIGHKIGATNAFGYDINAACSGFIYSLVTASKFIESGTYKKILVVGADKMSSIVDYEDRATCILFGDGAGAVLLEPSDNDFGIEDAVLKADGSGLDYLHMKAGGSMNPATKETVEARMHYAYQEGRVVFKAAIKGMAESIHEVVNRNGLTMDDIDWIVPHQANLRILMGVANQLNYPEEKVLINIEEYGNTTAATIPLCLRDFEHKLKKGDNIVLTAFGGGFTWGAILLKWGY